MDRFTGIDSYPAIAAVAVVIYNVIIVVCIEFLAVAAFQLPYGDGLVVSFGNDMPVAFFDDSIMVDGCCLSCPYPGV